MTAATTTTETRVVELVLEALLVAPWNARQTVDEAALAELTASIKEHGIQVPLLVRPVDDDRTREVDPGGPVTDYYEIIAGHRRYAAAKRIELATVPCIVRELDDDQAREVGLIDNLQREDVPALEEAVAFGELLDRLLSIEAVAARVGKEQSYVAKRLKLRTLTLEACDALRERLITVDHALLLCRLASAEQNSALKWCLDSSAGVKIAVGDVIDKRIARRKEREDDPESRIPGWIWEPKSPAQLKAHIEEDGGTLLDRAPWPMEEDWLLPDTESCLDCEKNTKANAPLFGDLDIGEPRCTDGECFRAKTEAFVQIRIKDAHKPGDLSESEAVRLSWKSTSTAPRMLKDDAGVNPKQTFKAGQWVEAKPKSCPHIRPAVTVDWSDAADRGYMGAGKELRKPGEILNVCIEPKCKAHPKAYEEAVAPSTQAAQGAAEKRAAAVREAERFKAFRAAESTVREALYEAIRGNIKPETVKRNLLANVLDYRGRNAVCWAAGCEIDDYTEREAYFRQRVLQAPVATLDALLFDAAFGAYLVIDANAMRAKDHGRAGLRELAKVAGVDAAAIERQFDAPAKAAAKKTAKKAAKAPAKKAAQKSAKKPAKKAAKKGGAK